MSTIAGILGGLVTSVVVFLWMVLRSRKTAHALAAELEQRTAEISTVQKQADIVLSEKADLHTKLSEAAGHWRDLDARHRETSGQLDALRERFRPILDVEAERKRLLKEIAERREAADREFESARATSERQRRQAEAEVQAARDAAQRDIASLRETTHTELVFVRAEVDREIQALTLTREQMQQQERELSAQLAVLRQDVESLDEAATLQSFGYYRKQYNFGTSAQYELLLEQVCNEQRTMIKAKGAALCHIEWLVNGSKREGQKQINQTLKLMLRAFNGEADAAIAKVTYQNFAVMEKRIRKAHEMINDLAEFSSAG